MLELTIVKSAAGMLALLLWSPGAITYVEPIRRGIVVHIFSEIRQLLAASSVLYSRVLLRTPSSFLFLVLASHFGLLLGSHCRRHEAVVHVGACRLLAA